MEEKLQQPPAKTPEKEQEKVIRLLEERLKKHDDNRKVVQGKLTEILTKLTEQVDGLEDRINRGLCETFSSEEDRLQTALNELRGNSTIGALQKAKAELLTIQSYEIIKNNFEANNDITTLYELKAERRTVSEDDHVEFVISGENSSIHNSSNTAEMSEILCGSVKFAEEREHLIESLKERLEEHYNNKKTVQDKLIEVVNKLRTQIVELEDRINKELEEKFTSEDNRLQAALNELRGNSSTNVLQKAKAELLVIQSYKIVENNFDLKHDLTTLYELKAERRIVPELMVRKPTNVRVAGINSGIISVQFTCLNLDEERVLSDNNIVNPVKFKCLLFKMGNEQESKEEYPLNDNDDNDSFTFTPNFLESETTYGIRVKIVVGDRESEWSDEIAEFTSPKFKECCVWKKCPDYVNEKRKYRVDEENPRIATKANSNGNLCTIIGNTYIPLNTVTSWNIKMLKSKINNGEYIYIGVAPNNINQNDKYNYYKCGWHFYCYYSTLWSGPPHSYYRKEHGPRGKRGQYVHDGDSVGVVVDTVKGDLSFVLNGVNLGVAFEGIPLDKPLVPCVLLYHEGDYVELTI